MPDSDEQRPLLRRTTAISIFTIAAALALGDGVHGARQSRRRHRRHQQAIPGHIDDDGRPGCADARLRDRPSDRRGPAARSDGFPVAMLGRIDQGDRRRFGCRGRIVRRLETWLGSDLSNARVPLGQRPRGEPCFTLRLPTLIVQGTADPFLLEPLTTRFVIKLRTTRAPVSYRRYPVLTILRLSGGPTPTCLRSCGLRFRR